jgi:hypothetical protein
MNWLFIQSEILVTDLFLIETSKNDQRFLPESDFVVRAVQNVVAVVEGGQSSCPRKLPFDSFLDLRVSSLRYNRLIPVIYAACS